MKRALLLGILLALAAGCATVMEEGPGTAADPWEQAALAELLDAGVEHAAGDLAGKTVRVKVEPPGAFFSRYARVRLEDGVRAAGGRAEPKAPAVLTLEVRVAGGDRAERNLALPVGEYLRLPLYYGQHDAGDLVATLTLREEGGTRTWDLSATRSGRTSYLFRVLGPF